MESTHIIRRPLITEKTTAGAELNRYAFEVDKKARKGAIKQAVEELYKVRVLDVATVRTKGRVRRTRYGYIQTKTMKKAIVKVHPEDRIEFF